MVRCADCEIRFLTDPRNAGREDLRCPFGCREHYRRQRASERSTAYYQTAAGKRKKKRLNIQQNDNIAAAGQSASQSLAAPPPSSIALADPLPTPVAVAAVPPSTITPADPPPAPLAEPQRDASAEKLEWRWEGFVLDEVTLRNSPLLAYVRVVVNRLEGLRLDFEELVELLQEAIRQHRLAWRRRVDYVVEYLHQHPP